jgi:hypothetical protein
MALHAGSDSIQCHGCLALMSLVRGEGEVCQSNQWHIAKAGAIEVIAQAMQTFRWASIWYLALLSALNLWHCILCYSVSHAACSGSTAEHALQSQDVFACCFTGVV